MKQRLLILAFFSILLFACSEQDEFEPESFDITGSWINQQILSDTIFIFDSSSQLKEGDYCFEFKAGGEFVERKNAGSCGTPPISYGDFEGIWSLSDSILDISVAYWGGMADYKWKVISLDENNLSIIWIEQEYRFSH